MKWTRTDKVLLLLCVIIGFSIITICLYFVPTPSTEIHYNITYESSIYRYPYWNITFNVNENITVKFVGYMLIYGEQIAIDQNFNPIAIDQTFVINLNNKLNVHIASGGTFIVILKFEQNKYQKFTLILPNE